LNFTPKELAKIVEQILHKQAEEERRRRSREVQESDAYIKEIHESSTGISPESFRIITESQTEHGDTIIEFEVVQWLDTEFTVNEPHQFNVEGKLLIRKNGTFELLQFTPKSR